MTLPKKLTSAEAEAKIQNIINQGGKIILSAHCKNESMKKRDVVFDDIKNALLAGKVIDCQWSDHFNNWKYEVEGTDLEGDNLNCITIFFDATFSMLIITVLERG
jgi:hypothetical protein